MQDFVRNLMYFLIIQGCVWAGVCVLYRQDTGRAAQLVRRYLAATIDKHNLLVQQPSPRIVFVGGSNLAFGLDSAEIQRRLGYHPINMGLDVDLGLDFMLQEVESFLKPGDVVVISPEYKQFASLFSGDAETLFEEIETQPCSVQFLTPRNLSVLLDKGLIVIGNITRHSINFGISLLKGERQGEIHPNRDKDHNNPYRRSAFNQFGDVTAHHDLARRDFQESQDEPPTPDSIYRVINRLNTFNSRCQRKGIPVFYSYPPLFQGEMQIHAQIIHEIASNLSRQLTFPLLDTPEEMSFPLDYIFDGRYHLNIVGKRIRTGHLIEKLLDRLPKANIALGTASKAYQ